MDELKDIFGEQELRDISSDLEERIKLSEQRLAVWRAEKSSLEQKIASGERYLDYLKAIHSAELARKGIKPETETRGPTPGRFVGVGVVKAAEVVLREAGKPMHFKEIHRLLEQGGVRAKSTSVSIMLKRYPQRFERVGPGQFKYIGEEHP